MKLRITVVMTTYNAGSHLLPQLESLRVQNRQPDEVLVFDDCSTDDTAQRISDYIAAHYLETWRLCQNASRKNWKQNFIDGMRQASGELIFPCDQDDVWHADKLAKMEAVMVQHPQILVLACDYHLVYEQGALTAKVYKKTEGEKNGLVTRYGFTKHFFMNPNPGCSFAVRKSFFDAVNSYWRSGFVYDEFLWLMALIQNGAYFYNEELLDYYRYGGNASSIRYKDIPMQLENLAYIASSLEQLEQYALDHAESVPQEYQKQLRTAKVWCQKRQKLMQTRNPLRWFALAPWWGYYNSPKNCLSDLWLAVVGKFERKI